jgi:hypothetical protein
VDLRPIPAHHRNAAGGGSEDAIFEVTAAVGAALRGYDAGLRALEQ